MFGIQPPFEMVAVAFLDLFHDLVLRAVKHVQRDATDESVGMAA
jgi:hypothetical protein